MVFNAGAGAERIQVIAISMERDFSRDMKFSFYSKISGP
jgi:hypothetical protein